MRYYTNFQKAEKPYVSTVRYFHINKILYKLWNTVSDIFFFNFSFSTTRNMEAKKK